MAITPPTYSLPLNTYLGIDDRVLSLYKWPPINIPFIAYGSSDDLNDNNLRGNQFQFAYRFLYSNFQRTTIGPVSDIGLPQFEEYANGDYVDRVYVNNEIYIAMQFEHWNIQKIELLVRKGNDKDWVLYDTIERNYSERYNEKTSGNIEGTTSGYYMYVVNNFADELAVGMVLEGNAFNGNTFIVKIEVNSPSTKKITLNRPAAQDIIFADGKTLINSVGYIFRNDKDSVSIDQKRANQLFEALPDLAGDLELIEGNRIVLSDVTEGRPPIDLNVALTRVINSYTPPTLSSDLTVNTVSQPNLLNYYITIPSVVAGGNYEIIIKSIDQDPTPDEEVTFVYRYTAVSGDTVSDIIAGLRLQAAASDPDINSGQHTPTELLIQLVEGKFKVTDPFNSITAKIYNPTPKNTSFKKGALHPFCIIYHDQEGRMGFALTNDDLKLYIPTNAEEGTTLFNYNTINLEITHQPPDWAHYYSIGYGLNKSLTKYFQFLINGMNDSSPDITVDPDSGKFRIAINRRISEVNDSIKKLAFEEYIWQKGDRIRFIARGNESSWTVFPSLLDYEIVGIDYDDVTDSYKKDREGDDILDGDGNKVDETAEMYIILEDFKNPFDPVVYGAIIPEYYIVEIYTPKTDFAEEIFYLVGRKYNISDPEGPNRYHEAPIQDQTSSVPGILQIEAFDSYFFDRYGLDALYPVESMNLSDYYKSTMIPTGLAHTVNDDSLRLRRGSTLRYSGKYFEDTKTNEVNRFFFGDQEQLASKYGEITGIREIGWVLKVVQPKKITSIYIGRTSSFNPDGTEDILLTDKLFGTIRPYLEDYGSRDPESISTNDQHLYFWDMDNGQWCRAAYNGIVPISDEGMATFFRSVKELIKTIPLYKRKIISVYDEKRDEFICSMEFTKDLVTTSVTLAFYESEKEGNRWKGIYSFIPDHFAPIGDSLISLEGGNIWLHEALVDGSGNPVYNTFYGISYSMIIEVISNVDFQKSKIFKGLQINANKKFKMENKGDLYIPISEQYPAGMNSLLPLNKFDKVEDGFVAEILRDMDTPGFSSEYDALVNGRPMTGGIIGLKVENDSTEKVVLYGIIVYITPNEFSK
jgi:hypothetical protein